MRTSEEEEEGRRKRHEAVTFFDDGGIRRKCEGLVPVDEDCDDDGGISAVSGKFQCMTLQKRQHSKVVEAQKSADGYGSWRRQEQRSIAERLGKQLKVRWELDDLIEEQLSRFREQCSQALGPARLGDVAQLLIPKWATPLQLALVGWFGDWRPTVILELLRGLARTTTILSDPAGVERALLRLVHEMRIEEAIIDEELAEIQATCVLRLPFALRNPAYSSGGASLSSVRTEFSKIKKVIAKAQQLRLKTWELVVRKVLNQTDAAIFLVMFERIQDALHQYAIAQRSSWRDTVTLPSKTLACISDKGSSGNSRNKEKARLINHPAVECKGRFRGHNHGIGGDDVCSLMERLHSDSEGRKYGRG
ncbi:hypothetical protein MLD38_029410 [Melastoma candidum]|uniref:Uncharacterized protein n=1 Tax=Melastoma candidum TaxID=119954 RepID=A0ACB9N6A3_9MYRT|nr:hypothetical protein MLD38_029410 [Melastoma candidum]